ncbi:MAG: sugar phosphate nucleotidyltransferase [Actinomycetota bacterium]|nr:sugar phosphate nucleotidyltransferase [Actinomycetota bacterium]
MSQCVILAGGLGTRMWPRAQTTPKTLLPVAGHPFAWWQLNWLAEAGIDSVVYCIGHLGEQVREFVGNGTAWGLHARFVDEGERLRGTAGALALAADQGELDEHFLVLYGDSLLEIDPADVLRAALDSGLAALMTVFENEGRWDGSNAVYADGRVLRYEKGLDPVPPEMRWIDYGLSVWRRDLIVARVPREGHSDLAPLCTALAAAGELAGYLASNRFYEIGSPEGLRAAEELLGHR